jgi:hypothetical protein
MGEEIYSSKDGPNLLEFRLGYMAFMGLFTKRSKSHYSTCRSFNMKDSGFEVLFYFAICTLVQKCTKFAYNPLGFQSRVFQGLFRVFGTSRVWRLSIPIRVAIL